MTSTDSPDADAAHAAPQADQAQNPYNFDAQKEIHQRIRNDPDYDDWEYGTEPLPHEAWVARQQAARGDGGAS
jgi:hypothetical protein